MLAVVALNDIAYEVPILLVSVANAGWFYFVYYRRFKRFDRITLQACFRVLFGVIVAIMLPLALVYLTGLLAERALDGMPAYVPIACFAVFIHQMWRGAAYVRRSWKSANDVRHAIRQNTIKNPAKAFAQKYDVTFFVGVSILSALLGRIVDKATILMVGTAVLTLIIPYACAAAYEAMRIVNRLVPVDELLSEPGWTASH